MADIPTRLLVLQRLQTLLESAPLVVQGVPQNLAGSVIRGRNIIGEDAPTGQGFLLSFIEAPRPDVAVFAGEEDSFRHDRWTILLQGTCEDDKLKPGDNAYWFYAAVEQRLGEVINVIPRSGKPVNEEYHLLGGLINSMEIAPPVCRPPGDKVTAKAWFYLPIRLGIALKLGEPYTSVV